MPDSSSSLFFPLAENIALASVMLLGYDHLRARIGRYGLRRMQAAFGALTGGVAILAMSHPIHIAPGVFVDGRWTIIGLCGFFGGSLGAAVAFALAAAYRISLGGLGLVTGVSGLLIAVVVGVGCRRMLKLLGAGLGYVSLLVPAALLGFAGNIPIIFLPADLRWTAFTVTGPAVMLTTAVGFWCFGALMIGIRRRMDAEAELNESRRRFAAIVENLPGVVYQRVMTPDGRQSYAFVSSRVADLLNVTPSEVTAGKYSLNDLIHPADRATVVADIRASAGPLAPAGGHFRMVRTDGTVRWVHAQSRPYRQSNGNVVWDGLLMDETDEVAAKTELRESKERYRLLSEAAMDMVVRCTLDGRRFYASPSSTRVLGYEIDALIGTSPVDLAHPEDRAAVREAFAGLSPAVDHAMIIYRSRHRDGHYIWLELALRLILDEEGQPREIMCAARDITARIGAEQALAATAAKLEAARNEAEEAREKAEAGNRAKSAFLAKMSHEIRTPMHGILGMAHLLRRTALDPRQQSYAASIIESTTSLMSLVNDILDMSKLEAGRLQLEVADFVMVDVVDECLALLRPAAAEKGLRLEHELAPEARVRFRGDPTRLRQVLLNLVENAIKFTEQGSVRLLVSGEAIAGETATLRMEVIDTGIGVEPAALPRLFDNFTQADDSITRRFGGSGLGLAISRRLVEMMGGEIGVDSRLGQGSRFWCTVRLGIAVAPASAAGSVTTPASAALPAGPKAPAVAPRLLVAEDVMVNQLIATELLERLGCSVDLAQNGREAVEAVRTGDYDLVLMDVHMPLMDGLEAARAIRALDEPRSRVPIIAMTADVVAGVREQYLAAGMDDFLPKPFAPHELEEMIERWTDGLAADSATAAADGDEATRPSSAAASAIVDEQRLADIAGIMSAEKFDALIESWLQSTADRLDRIRLAAKGADLAQLRREAHDLVSTAGNIGASHLAAIARRLESACVCGDEGGVAPLVDEIGAAAPSACAAVRKRLAIKGQGLAVGRSRAMTE
jgi:PAS domain S-box-containing protein